VEAAVINLSIPQEAEDLKPRITVIGVGGAGGNAVNNMVRANLVGCEFIACNSDSQAIKNSLAGRKIQLGQTVTRGLGAGSRPDVGRAAAEEAMEEILDALQGSNMVFITAGMGGGTGTGAAPVIARAARESGILTVGVVTKPFHFEGTHRMRLAEAGITELQKYVDTLIIIPNQNLFRVANEKTTFADAFKMADDVLHAGVRGVTDLMVMPGLINLDFADIRAVMSEMGKAMMGTGEADGERRAIDAAEAAISNPLLEDVSMKGARGVLINITGGGDMTLFEVDEAANRIREEVDPEANIIFGSTFDENLSGKIRISVVATGIDAEVAREAKPTLTVVAGGKEAVLPAAAAAPQPPLLREAASGLAADAEASTPAAALAEQAALAGGAFIAPKPVEPAVPRPVHVAAPVATPDAGSMTVPAKKRGPSLFERVTGVGRARMAAPAAAQPERPAPAQPRLGTVDPADRLSVSKSEDELLDIPAFLRRQAN
jgi:cell division protein FtsZ